MSLVSGGVGKSGHGIPIGQNIPHPDRNGISAVFKAKKYSVAAKTSRLSSSRASNSSRT